MKNLIKNSKFYIFCLITMFLLLESCISRVEKRGYMFEMSDYEFLEEGVTNKQKALQIMGSSTFSSYLAENEILFYYSEDVKHLLFFKPKIIARKVVSLKFDENNILSKIQEYDLAAQKNFSPNLNITKVKSNEIGFFKSIFSNIGTVTPQ